ncbi:hypothetical protein ID866_8730, partial [Astraeus odoratus]
MDTFSEPYTRAGDDVSLDAVREQVRALEDAHRANGVPLSGRIVHVCHYIPVVPSLVARAPTPAAAGVLSPPPTPPVVPGDVPPSPSDEAASSAEQQTQRGHQEQPAGQKRWKLAPRYGHAAMFSGIRSLSATHEQLIVGWTGDIVSVSDPGTPSSEENVTQSGERVPQGQVSQADKDALEAELVGYDEDGQVGRHKIEYIPVWLEDKVAHGHYEGYCKTTLWPLFHYLLWQDVATEYASVDANYQEYEQANQAFASRLASVIKPGDVVWVHDYHLLLVPRLLRAVMGERGAELVIGLFVHTPFPSSEVFRCLPRRKEILEGMLGANLVCFQTYSYSRHFLSTCVRVCGHETTSRTVPAPTLPANKPCCSSSCTSSPSASATATATSMVLNAEKYVGVDVHGHFVAVGHCPVGVDAQRVKRDTLRPGVQPKLDA